MELTRLDATALRALFLKGEVSAVEILRAHEARIAATEPTIQAFQALTPAAALRDAQALDDARRKGADVGPLAGVPVAIKDVLCVKGVPATCGSRILESYVPPYDATCVSRLKQAGAVVLGKTNMDEFAMGSSTEHSAFKNTRNPWDLSRVPGGSSGGSAAAVAAFQAPLAVGTDTGGSIRQPAAFTGTVGLKPTYGRVSRWGLVAFASSLDQAGPFSRSVRDAALSLGCMAGPDRRDMTCSDQAVPDYLAGIAARRGSGGPVAGLRVGVPKEFFGVGLDPEVEASVRACHKILAREGAELVEVSLPTTGYAIATYYLVATAEASSNLARYDGVRYGFRHPESGNLRDMYNRTRVA
ncbi:MAG TPA: amidase family protein, partial [Candidatus Polarisedimenticolia bacterium]|nr:amidase family protein [Candidatus Polarisedimenticolia bacterium]